VNQKPDTVQTAVRLPREMLEKLRQSSDGVSEEIRTRLARTLEEDADPPTRALVVAIDKLAVLVRLQTGHDWYSHPAAHRVFKQMIVSRLVHLKPSGEAVFGSDELPPMASRLVASDDPETMGMGLEAIERFHRPLSIDEIRELEKKTGYAPRGTIPPGFKGSLSDLMALREQEDKGDKGDKS
jgi:hypothetical protein